MKNLSFLLSFLLAVTLLVACTPDEEEGPATDDLTVADTAETPDETVTDDTMVDETVTDETTADDQSDQSDQSDSTDQPVTDDTVIDETPDTDSAAVEPCTDYATVFPLQPGDCVPDFTLPAHDGTMITLSDYRGKFVLLSSFPMVNTSVCTGQMQTLDGMYDQFIAANAQPFGFNNEPPDQKDEWCETMGVTKLLILSDHNPKDAVSTMFGINGAYTKRANTYIGPDGRFLKMEGISGSAGIAPALAYIQSLQ